eukprot:1191361-Prorocentrum_minimum.AAC.2
MPQQVPDGCVSYDACDVSCVCVCVLCVVRAGPRGEQWEKVGNWTQGERRRREIRGVESTLAIIGPGGPVKLSHVACDVSRVCDVWYVRQGVGSEQGGARVLCVICMRVTCLVCVMCGTRGRASGQGKEEPEYKELIFRMLDKYAINCFTEPIGEARVKASSLCRGTLTLQLRYHAKNSTKEPEPAGTLHLVIEVRPLNAPAASANSPAVSANSPSTSSSRCAR